MTDELLDELDMVVSLLYLSKSENTVAVDIM